MSIGYFDHFIPLTIMREHGITNPNALYIFRGEFSENVKAFRDAHFWGKKEGFCILKYLYLFFMCGFPVEFYVFAVDVWFDFLLEVGFFRGAAYKV